MTRTSTGHRLVPSLTVSASGSLGDFELTSRAALRARVAPPISSVPVVGLSSSEPSVAPSSSEEVFRDCALVLQRRELAGMHVRGEAPLPRRLRLAHNLIVAPADVEGATSKWRALTLRGVSLCA